MGETAIPVPASTELRRLVPAIVGAVLLGESLWNLLHLLVRDWGAPALANLLGQGPTTNQGAFEPLPLLLAFVETCVAGILLVSLMAWSRRGSRVVVVRSAQTAASISVVPPATEIQRQVEPARPVEPVPPVHVETSTPSRPVPQPVLQPVITQTVTVPEPVSPPPLAGPSPVAAAAPIVAAPKPSAPVEPPKPKSKKPKVVYYNSVGEPIESDD